jgi:hypothetical protein
VATSVIEPALAAWPHHRKDWGELHSLASRPTIFLSEAWVDAWLGVFGPSLRPYLWTARADDAVIGAALLVRRVEWRGPVPVRCLYLNTSGEGADSVTVEHNTVLARPGYEEMVWRELGTTLLRLPWDELVLCGGDTATAERMRHLFPGWRISLKPRAAPFIPLEAVRQAPDGFLGLLSANTRGQLRRAARAAVQHGPIALDEGTTPASREELWMDLRRLHTNRWRQRNLPGAFFRPRWVAFHEQLQQAAPTAARLFRLRLGDQTVAAVYLLQHGGHVAFYQSGVLPDAALARAKPGLLLHLRVIERLAAEESAEYDFLASDEPEVRYKRSLATHERPLWWGAVLRPSWRTWLTARLRELRQSLRASFGSRLPARTSEQPLLDGLEESVRFPRGEILVGADQRGRPTA